MALIYIFKSPQPGQEDGILNPSTGSAREEDMAIAMSRFSLTESLVYLPSELVLEQLSPFSTALCEETVGNFYLLLSIVTIKHKTGKRFGIVSPLSH